MSNTELDVRIRIFHKMRPSMAKLTKGAPKKLRAGPENSYS